MPRREPLSDLNGISLAELALIADESSRPLVESWTPSHCGHSGIRIAKDGGWWHEGHPIGRPGMVRLFGSILRREADGRLVLVTPVEKLDIDVEDTPFVAVEVRSDNEGAERMLAFRLNTGDPVIAGPRHPIRVEQNGEEPRPTLIVREGIAARIARPVYYELAAMALTEGTEPPGLWSGGEFFRLDGVS